MQGWNVSDRPADALELGPNCPPDSECPDCPDVTTCLYSSEVP